MTDKQGNQAPNPETAPGETEPEIYELEPADESVATDKQVTDTATETTENEAETPESEKDTPASADASSPPATAMARTPDAPFTRGIGGIRAAMTGSAVLLLLALIMTGVRAGDTRLSALLLTLASMFLLIVVNGALGTLAVIAAARCVGTRVAEPELFALRMLAASAAFALLYETGTPIPTRIDDFVLGLAGYATTVWLLFRLPPRETGLVVAWHAGLVAVFWLGATIGPRADVSPSADPGESASEPGDNAPILPTE